jgi:hypothetical protein
MTEMEWQGCDNIDTMLPLLGDSLTPRKWRLFACACCRRLWPSLLDPRSRNAVEVSESFADGQVDPTTLTIAWQAAMDAKEKFLAEGVAWLEIRAAWAAQWAASSDVSWVTWKGAENKKYEWERSWWLQMSSEQPLLLRDIFNPFYSRTLDRPWLRDHGREVLSIAQRIYEERSFNNVRLLLIALENSRCDDQLLLDHLRFQKSHVKGCWVIDELLDKR